MYKKLFTLSNLSNHEICKRLDITHTVRQRFESKGKKIDLETFVRFSRALGVSDKDATELVTNEISKLWKQYGNLN